MSAPSRWLVVASTVALGVALCWPDERMARARPRRARMLRVALVAAVVVACVSLVVWP